VLVRTQSRDSIKKSNQITKNVALHFRENAAPYQAKSITYAMSTRANCRRMVKLDPTPVKQL
jgi:hypothetical protein